MKVAIVIIETLHIPCIYDADAPQQSSYGGEWGDPEISLHIEIPSDFDPEEIKAIKSEDGSITLIQDPSKVQAKLDLAWADLRARRNQLLAACDWTQLVDTHMSQDRKEAWAEYRQALRDLPETATDPTQVNWPLDPTQQPPVPVSGSRLDNLLSQS